jgi:hypothetical protein
MNTFLAPIPKKHQRLLLEMMGAKRASQKAMQEFAATTDIEFRDIPLKARVLQDIASTAWEMVDELRHLGVKFAGTTSEAAAVVTGTAYASWRAGTNRKMNRHEPEAPYTHAMHGLWHGILYAMAHRKGIPAMYRYGYLHAIAGSDDPIDRRPLWDTLAELWPDAYRNRKITTFRQDGEKPRYMKPDDPNWGWDDDLWANEPNPLDDITTPFVTGEREKRRAAK